MSVWVFLDEISILIGKTEKAVCPSRELGGRFSSNLLGGLNRTKGAEGVNSSLSSGEDQSLNVKTLSSAGSQAFGLGQELYHILSWVSSL